MTLTFEFDGFETVWNAFESQFQPELQVVGEPLHLLSNTASEEVHKKGGRLIIGSPS